MSRMRGLTLIVASGDPERLRSALTLACAHAALGGSARLHCEEAAVGLLVDLADAGDAERARHGLPTRAQLIATTLEAGVAVSACQTGLALAGATEGALPAGVETGGTVALLAALHDEDRLVVI